MVSRGRRFDRFSPIPLLQCLITLICAGFIVQIFSYLYLIFFYDITAQHVFTFSVFQAPCLLWHFCIVFVLTILCISQFSWSEYYTLYAMWYFSGPTVSTARKFFNFLCYSRICRPNDFLDIRRLLVALNTVDAVCKTSWIGKSREIHSPTARCRLVNWEFPNPPSWLWVNNQWYTALISYTCSTNLPYIQCPILYKLNVFQIY